MITVDTVGIGGRQIVGTVSVGGIDAVCINSSNFSTLMRSKPPARKFDEFGTVKLRDRKARLDNYGIELQNDPTAQGPIIAYAGRKSAKGAAALNLKKRKRIRFDSGY